MHKLIVAFEVDAAYAMKPKCRAVKSILGYHGFDIRPNEITVWRGFIDKLLHFIDTVRELAALGAYTHLMFIDASDVVLLDGPDEVMRRYFAFNHPWVSVAEPFIWTQDSFTPEDYPTPDCLYRYFNAGASIGEISHLLKWVNWWTDNGKRPPVASDLPRGDQDWFAERFIAGYPDAMILDHQCELFQCMCGSLVGDDPHCVMTPGKVHNNITGTDPIIIHFNGGDDITTPDRRELWQHWI